MEYKNNIIGEGYRCSTKIASLVRDSVEYYNNIIGEKCQWSTTKTSLVRDVSVVLQ